MNRYNNRREKMVKFMDRCNKYETLYIFQNDDQALLKHIKDCEECRSEYKKDKELEQLIKEVKPFLLRSNKKIPFLKLKAVASLIIIFLCFFALGTLSINKLVINNTSQSDLLKNETSIVELNGCPTDEYGLLKIE